MPGATANFGWQKPSSTDLASTGPAVIGSALDAIDAEMVDLTPALPTISSLSTSTGGPGGGTAVTVTGSGFALSPTPVVRFGAAGAGSVVVVSTTSITCVSPAHVSGATTVTVTTLGGTSNAVAFTYSGSTSAPFRPEVAAISWDAPNPTLGRDLPYPERSTTRTSFSYLIPSRGWDYNGVAAGVLQSRVDADILDAASAGIGHFARVWYPTAPAIPESVIAQARLAHMRSAFKTQCRQAHILFLNGSTVPPGTPFSVQTLWVSTYIPAIVAEMLDPSYATVTVNGVVRPVYYVFCNPDLTSATYGWGSIGAALTALNALRTAAQSAGLGDPYMVDVTADVFGLAAGAGMDAVGSYWIPAPLPSGHSAYSVVSTKDSDFRVASTTLHKVPCITGFCDANARGVPGWHPGYADQATYRDLEDNVTAALTWMAANTAVAANKDPAHLATLYAWNENEEGGGSIQPTTQEGVTYLDAVRAAISGSLPSSYPVVIDSDSTQVTYAGTWSSTFPVPNLHRNQESTTSTTNDTATIVINGVTQFELRAMFGPDRGIMEIKIDGTVVASPDLYMNAASPGIAFRSGTLSAAQHTIVLRCTGTKNALSSSNKIGLDRIKATIDRATSGPPVVTYTVDDTGAHSDSTTAPGSCVPSGQAYTVTSGTFGRTGTKLYCPAGAAGNTNGADVICSVSDASIANAAVTIEAKMTSTANESAGFAFRFVDANNMWLIFTSSSINEVRLYKAVAGTFTQVGSSFTGVAAGTEYTYQAVIAAGNVTIMRNGTQIISAQAMGGVHSTATSAGPRISIGTGDGSARFDDMRVT